MVKEHKATLQSLGGHTVKLLKLVKLPLHGLHLWGFTKNEFWLEKSPEWLCHCLIADVEHLNQIRKQHLNSQTSEEFLFYPHLPVFTHQKHAKEVTRIFHSKIKALSFIRGW